MASVRQPPLIKEDFQIKYCTEAPPLDGTWITAWDYGADRVIQYDPKAFGGKGGWFNQKGHATKPSHPIHGWRIDSRSRNAYLFVSI